MDEKITLEEAIKRIEYLELQLQCHQGLILDLFRLSGKSALVESLWDQKESTMSFCDEEPEEREKMKKLLADLRRAKAAFDEPGDPAERLKRLGGNLGALIIETELTAEDLELLKDAGIRWD